MFFNKTCRSLQEATNRNMFYVSTHLYIRVFLINVDRFGKKKIHMYTQTYYSSPN
jgi:hypothetical protein